MDSLPPYFFNIVHIALIGPLLIYIGVNKEKTPPFIFKLLIFLALGMIPYHAYRLKIKLQNA